VNRREEARVTADFGDQLERHRIELLTHCYRMLGSRHDAEDITQESLLRAWRGRETYAGDAAVRTWLFRIATNACLDLLRTRRRRPVTLETDAHPTTTGATSPAAVPWLEPLPDSVLTSTVEDRLVARETVELVLVAAIQHLPPRQRAVFALRDVLDWSTAEVAAALDTTTTAIHSTLQRARATLRSQLPAERSDWSSRAEVSAAERAVLDRYIAAIEAGDDAAIGRLLHPDVRVGHLPHAGGLVGDQPAAYAGRVAVVAAWAPLLHADPPIDVRLLPTTANRQPAVATYSRAPGAEEYQAFALNVLRIEQDLVTEVVTFPAATVGAFGLPERLTDEDPGPERQ
jgi:RNA polymerase sigma-70 factor, ECF subfamily